MHGVDADLTLLGKQGDCYHEDITAIQREQKKQKVFNCWMEEKMQVMEGMIKDQAERIVALEEVVTIPQTKKVCKCGEGGASSARTGTQEDPLDIDLEYTYEEGSSSGGSYHTPPRAAEEPLCVFGSPVSQHLPEDV